MKKTLVTLGLILTLGGRPVMASPTDDTPRGVLGKAFHRVVSAVKHLLHTTPLDEIQVPRP